jgi:hypothetical protein
MWRQGDIYIDKIDQVPKGARKLDHCVLAEGEVTGHMHQVVDLETAELYVKGGKQYLNVKAESAVVSHDEHGPVTLPKGTYSVWRQREYTPKKIRYVTD